MSSETKEFISKKAKKIEDKFWGELSLKINKTIESWDSESKELLKNQEKQKQKILKNIVTELEPIKIKQDSIISLTEKLKSNIDEANLTFSEIYNKHINSLDQSIKDALQKWDKESKKRITQLYVNEENKLNSLKKVSGEIQTKQINIQDSTKEIEKNIKELQVKVVSLYDSQILLMKNSVDEIINDWKNESETFNNEQRHQQKANLTELNNLLVPINKKQNEIIQISDNIVIKNNDILQANKEVFKVQEKINNEFKLFSDAYKTAKYKVMIYFITLISFVNFILLGYLLLK